MDFHRRIFRYASEPIRALVALRKAGQVELSGRRLNNLARPDLAGPSRTMSILFCEGTEKSLSRRLRGFRRYSRIAYSITVTDQNDALSSSIVIDVKRTKSASGSCWLKLHTACGDRTCLAPS